MWEIKPKKGRYPYYPKMKKKWMKMDCGHEKTMIEKHLSCDKNHSFYIIEWYCKTCGMFYEECDRDRVFINEVFLQDHIIDNSFYSIDLHGMGLW